MPCKPDGPCANCKCAPSSSSSSSSSPPKKQRLWRIDNDLVEDIPAVAAQPESTPATVSAPAAVATDDDSACELKASAAPERQTCCKTLKAQEQSTVDPDLIRDIIIGLSDGLTVPFALTAGLSGTNSSRIVVIAGLAELVSGAISMGVGGFLSAQTEVDHYRYRMQTTRQRVLASCNSQLERDVAEILSPYGVPNTETNRIARALHDAEKRMSTDGDESNTRAYVRAKKEQVRRFRWLAHLPVVGSTVDRSERGADKDTEKAISDSDTNSESQQGMTAFLLRLGEGLEPVSMRRAYISAIAMGLSYFLGGLVSLIPYFCTSDVYKALYISISVTGTVLFVFGAVKMRASGAPPSWRIYLFGALSTLLVGAAAAGASFGIVRALEGNKSLGA